MTSHLRFTNPRSQTVIDRSYLQLLKNFYPKVNGYRNSRESWNIGVLEYWDEELKGK